MNNRSVRSPVRYTRRFPMLPKLAAAGEKTLPNARNATAGTLKQLDPRIVAKRPVNAVFYAVGACEGIEFESHADMLKALAEFGLPTQKKWWVCQDIAEVLRVYRKEIVANYWKFLACPYCAGQARYRARK